MATMTSRTPRGDDSASPKPLTRTQVAKRLGTHVTSVRRLERARKLNPTKNEHGVWLFDSREVDQIALKRSLDQASGEVASKVFKALHDGFGLREIVIAFALPPHVVRGLYADWLAMEPPRRASYRAAGEPQGDAPAGSSETPPMGDPDAR